MWVWGCNHSNSGDHIRLCLHFPQECKADAQRCAGQPERGVLKTWWHERTGGRTILENVGVVRETPIRNVGITAKLYHDTLKLS